MSDLIYYKNGEETFRISPPTVETKCPETKLEVKKMTEKERIQGEIKVLQSKLALLEEMEHHKTPAEEAFKRVYCRYPDKYDSAWDSFEKGYARAQKDYKVGEYQPTSQEPEELKTLYQMWNDGECRDDICYLVKIWMSQYADNVMCGEYKKGYEYCLLVLEENLK